MLGICNVLLTCYKCIMNWVLKMPVSDLEKCFSSNEKTNMKSLSHYFQTCSPSPTQLIKNWNGWTWRKLRKRGRVPFPDLVPHLAQRRFPKGPNHGVVRFRHPFCAQRYTRARARMKTASILFFQFSLSGEGYNVHVITLTYLTLLSQIINFTKIRISLK